jgi:3-oxoacyl-[acyl-carrier-protein] synthase II
MAQAMRDALRDAGLQPQDIGHINAHGLGTPEADRIESQAIQDVFGEQGSRVPVTAFKSYLGNPGSSCGTLELAGSLLGLTHGVVLPTLNYTTPDPACPLNIVAGQPLPVDNRVILKVSVTRMGQASAVVVQGA